MFPSNWTMCLHHSVYISVCNNFFYHLQKHSLLIVVGPVGAGKSSLLQCILGELKPRTGSVTIKGHVSYASQEAWIFSGTLRDNILFGHPYNSAWYKRVIGACALDSVSGSTWTAFHIFSITTTLQDIEQLNDGDLTLVGERGVTLSGGQRARVNLARAIYHDADIFILDDPLSAVDVAVAKHIFDRCSSNETIVMTILNRLTHTGAYVSF